MSALKESPREAIVNSLKGFFDSITSLAQNIGAVSGPREAIKVQLCIGAGSFMTVRFIERKRTQQGVASVDTLRSILENNKLSLETKAIIRRYLAGDTGWGKKDICGSEITKITCLSEGYSLKQVNKELRNNELPVRLRSDGYDNVREDRAYTFYLFLFSVPDDAVIG